MTTLAFVDGTPTLGTDPTIIEAAQNFFRIQIGEVPGTGSVLGVWLYEGQAMAFREQTNGFVAMFESTSDGWIEKYSGLPTGGRYEFVDYNFGQKTKVYGACGAHKAFEWDGSTWSFITTGIVPDKPNHVAATGNYLWVSVGSQIENSPVANPTGIWSLRTGSNLINTVGDVTSLQVEAGNLVALDRDKVWIHYGTPADPSTERFENLSDKTGAIEWSAQSIGKIRYLDDFGLTDLYRTDAYGDFEQAAFSEAIRPMLVDNKGHVTESLSIRQFNEYVLFLDDGRAIVCDFKRNKVLGFSVFNYGRAFTCAVSGDDETETERLFAGAENGYVYELEKGTSFDGDPIVSWAQPSYHHHGYPRNRKRYRRMSLYVDTQDDLTLLVRADYDMGGQAMAELTESISANNGLWDGTWQSYSIAPEPASQVDIALEGSALNMAPGFYNSSTINRPFTISSYTADISVRARQRQ